MFKANPPPTQPLGKEEEVSPEEFNYGPQGNIPLIIHYILLVNVHGGGINASWMELILGALNKYVVSIYVWKYTMINYHCVISGGWSTSTPTNQQYEGAIVLHGLSRHGDSSVHGLCPLLQAISVFCLDNPFKHNVFELTFYGIAKYGNFPLELGSHSILLFVRHSK